MNRVPVAPLIIDLHDGSSKPEVAISSHVGQLVEVSSNFIQPISTSAIA